MLIKLIIGIAGDTYKLSYYTFIKSKLLEMQVPNTQFNLKQEYLNLSFNLDFVTQSNVFRDWALF